MAAMELLDQPVAGRSTRDPGIFATLRPGQAVMVQESGSPKRYWGRIIGTDPYEYFFVKLPLVPGITRLVKPGAALTLRLETEGELFGFSCEVFAATHKPYPLVVLAYPASVERIQLRRSKRVRCLIPVLIKNDFFTSQALIVDLSRGGCRLVLDMFQKQQVIPLISGDAISLLLSLAPSGSLECKATVVSVTDTGQGRFLGARFDPCGEDACTAIDEFMDRLEAIDQILGKDA